jgi:Domain of unknown function (DUF4417)
MEFEGHRQRALIRGCEGCFFQGDCDEPIEPCPPVTGPKGRLDRKMISPANPFIWKWIESVGGIDLDAAWPESRQPALPPIIPAFKASLWGEPPARTAWAGFTIPRIFTQDGRLRFPSSTALRKHYNLAEDSRLILVMVGKDTPLEKFWARRDTSVYSDIAGFGFAGAIAPNYSVFLQRSPLEHLVNYKRSLIVATALARAGVPTVPHVYAGGRRAVARWVDYLRKYPSITSIAREVQTTKTEIAFMQSLVLTKAITSQVQRPLRVVFIGPLSRRRVELIHAHFGSYSLVTTHLSMLASHYRILRPSASWLEAHHDMNLIPARAFEANLRYAEWALRSLRAERAIQESGGRGPLQADQL